MNSPAVLLTSSPEIAANIDAEVQRQLTLLSTADAAGPAWRDYGEVILVDRCTLTGMHSRLCALAPARTCTESCLRDTTIIALMDSWALPLCCFLYFVLHLQTLTHSDVLTHTPDATWGRCSDEELVKVGDKIASEHTQIIHKDPQYFLNNMKNYG